MEINFSKLELELIKFLLNEGMKLGKAPVQMPDGSESYMAKECVLLYDRISSREITIPELIEQNDHGVKH